MIPEENVFEWDDVKDAVNTIKHGISFFEAQAAFSDRNCIIAEDHKHSDLEKRFYCFGLVNDAVLTVRFTYRNKAIRIIGAGYWRQGEKIYVERTNHQRHGIH